MKINKHIEKLDYPEYAKQIPGVPKVDLSTHKGKNSRYSYLLSQSEDILKKIAKIEGLRKENVLITAGADAALHHIAETFLDQGKTAVIPLPSFGRFEFHTKVVGAKAVFVRHVKFPYSFDLEKVTRIAKKRKASAVFLANPNNPTGELISKIQLKLFAKENSMRLVVVDEALIEEARDSVGKIVDSYSNLIIVKSLSKIFSVPGLRIGYLLANQVLLKSLAKTVSPYEVSSLSLLATKSLNFDSEYLAKRVEELKKARGLLKKKLTLPLSNTRASVGLIEGGVNQKPGLFDYLLKYGILTVNGRNFRGLEKTNTVRIIINSRRDIEKLIKVIKDYGGVNS